MKKYSAICVSQLSRLIIRASVKWISGSWVTFSKPLPALGQGGRTHPYGKR